jgi:hypothetical protein
MSASSVEATRELCNDLDSFLEIAKQGRAPIRAVCASFDSKPTFPGRASWLVESRLCL